MNAHRISIPFITWMLLAGTAAAQSPVAVAVVLRPDGEAVLVRADARLLLATGTRLQSGDSIHVPAGASVRVLHSTGRIENLTQGARLTSAGGGTETLFGRSLRTLASVAAADPGALLNRQGMIRPIPGAAVAVSPRNGVTVVDPPELVWFSIPEASGYTLQLRPLDGSPVRYTLGPDTVWHPDTPLRAGTDYEWTIAARPAGRPAAPQRFRVADALEAARVRKTVGDAATSDDLLVAALIYHDAGWLYHARSALDSLVTSGTPIAPDLHRLHAAILAALGEDQSAAAALRRALEKR